jgi:DNA-binding NtrC family response regulator
LWPAPSAIIKAPLRGNIPARIADKTQEDKSVAKKILIVDDNPNMSSLLSEMLEVFDYDSVRAGDGQEALRLLEDGGISMVITDLRMPSMSGTELLKQVKEKYPKLPVVLISGYSATHVEASSGGIQADGFLGKPLMMSQVEKMLNSLL